MQHVMQSSSRPVCAFLAAMVMAIVLAAPAWGGGCPGRMAEIDQRLAAGPSLEAVALEEVVCLRAEGDAMHRQGQHGAAMAALQEALAILEEEADAGHHDHH
jgi:hypothetical protein